MKKSSCLAIIMGSIFLIAAFAPLMVSADVDMAPKIRETSTTTSTNWCGYAVDASKGAVTDVKGSWTVPVATGSGTSYSSFWIGIDGDNSNTVEQIGTDSDVVNGVATYYAWYEMYPKNSYNINHPVNAGDQMTGEVQYIGSNKYVLTLDDISANWVFSITLTSGSAKRTSAEWIAEAPWMGGVLPLANFNTVTFTGCTATIGKVTGTIGSFNYETINMVTSSGAIKASTGTLTKSGDSFTITWKGS